MVKTVDYILRFHKDFYEPIKQEYKTATTRANSKPLNIDDYVIATFEPSDKLLLLRIAEHYAMRLKDLNTNEARNEGYRHPDLLKHELRNIYPELTDDSYVYIYTFRRQSQDRKNIIDFRETHEFINGEWVDKK